MLIGKTLPVTELTGEQCEAMFAIMEKYYYNILLENFIKDIQSKGEVVLLCDDTGSIRGFTTIAVFLHNKHTQLVFSGDTVIEKEYWGDKSLSQTWIKRTLCFAERFHGKTYWLLLTKGYKTYKFLHTFFKEFYPCVDTKTPQELQDIIDTFATRQYGDKYVKGVYIEGKDYLKDEFAHIGSAQLSDKNTAFFVEMNPGYVNGDELVCLCEISVENLNKLGRRVLGR
jgi:hypothetical protein